MRNFSTIEKGLDALKSEAPKMDQAERELWKEVDIRSYRNNLSVAEMHFRSLQDLLEAKNFQGARDYAQSISEIAQSMIDRIGQIDLGKVEKQAPDGFPVKIIREVCFQAPIFLRRLIQETNEALEKGVLDDPRLEEIEKGFEQMYSLGEQMAADPEYGRYRNWVSAQGEKGRG